RAAHGGTPVAVRFLRYLFKGLAASWEFGMFLNGKSALITGSSQGIGLGVAQAFAASGAKVVVTSEKPLAKCPEVQRLLSDYEHTRYVQADLLADGEPERLVAEAWSAFGGIDVLVNNLGTYKEPPLDEITRDHFDFIFRLN